MIVVKKCIPWFLFAALLVLFTPLHIYAASGSSSNVTYSNPYPGRVNAAGYVECVKGETLTFTASYTSLVGGGGFAGLTSPGTAPSSLFNVGTPSMMGTLNTNRFLYTATFRNASFEDRSITVTLNTSNVLSGDYRLFYVRVYSTPAYGLPNVYNHTTAYFYTDITVLGSAVSVAGVSLNKTETVLYAGREETLTASIIPSNATNKAVTWSSSNNSVATVVNGKVKGVAPGSAVITATTADGGKTASCRVTVVLPRNISISTEAELRAIPNGAADSYFLSNDINLTSEWTPIMDFGGNFYGQGHTIHNLYVLEGSRRIDAGFFGTITGGAEITGLGINVGAQGVTAFSNSVTVHAGALAGHIDNISGNVTIKNCYAIGGPVKARTSADASPGYCYAGGLIGRTFGAGGTLTVENCFAENNVIVNAHTDSYSGGLIGTVYNNHNVTAAVRNCYAAGSVTVTTQEGGYTGGLTGFIWGLYGDSVIFENCYAAGDVTDNTGPPSDAYSSAGGLFGYTVELYNCYRLSTQSIVCGGYENTLGTALTPGQMRNSASFTNWDFVNVWTFAEGVNNGYPILRAFDAVDAFVPVIGISGVPETATAGIPLTLTGTVSPSGATNKTIVWSVASAGTTGASISGGTLNTSAAGTVIIRATIINGLTAVTNYTQEFSITVIPQALPDGWAQEDGGWYFYSGGVTHKGWLRNGSLWYYMDPASGLMRTGWVLENGIWYYMKPGGAMAEGEWINAGGIWYYMKPGGAMAGGEWIREGSTWYYIKPIGAMASGEWLQEYPGVWYYLHHGGAMATGIEIIDGRIEEFAPSGLWLRTIPEADAGPLVGPDTELEFE